VRFLVYGLFVLCLMVLLIGCNSSPTPVGRATSIPTPLETPGASPVATPTSSSHPTPPVLSDKSLGGVTGRFILEATGKPAGGFAIYLGERLPLEPGDQYAITIQQNSSPHVEVDPSGNFAFTDIKPGTYALVLWTLMKSQIIADPRDPNKELVVAISPGQITDLGDVVSNLP
jgi:hypothetical protein